MNKETIAAKLTFEQFKEYADREPSLEGNWIYILGHVLIRTEADFYPEFEVCTNEYYFLTFEDARKYIHQQLANEKKGTPDTYCFTISQIAIGAETWERRGASWLYDYKGNLVDYSIATWQGDPYKSSFFGRSESRLRFKKGDIVEIFENDRVYLAVVAAEGPSVEWFWGLYNRSKDDFGYYADASDDCYYTLDGPGFVYHSHVPSVAMMKPRFPVPDDVREFFRHCLEVADQEDCSDKYRCFDGPLDYVKNISETQIQIVFDKDTKRNILVKKVADYVAGNKTYQPIKAEEQELIDRLNDVRYGKTRLWYIIRDWNENCRDLDDSGLSLDTPIEDLIN